MKKILAIIFIFIVNIPLLAQEDESSQKYSDE